MQHTRIRLENSGTGEEIRIEGGITSFPEFPYRVRMTGGRGDNAIEMEYGQYPDEESLFRHIDSFVKTKLAKGYKIVLYKIDDLDIDWLSGININGEHNGIS